MFSRWCLHWPLLITSTHLKANWGFLTHKVPRLNHCSSGSDKGGPVCQHFFAAAMSAASLLIWKIKDWCKCKEEIRSMQTKLAILFLRKTCFRITTWINEKGTLASVCKAGVNLNPSTFPLWTLSGGVFVEGVIQAFLIPYLSGRQDSDHQSPEKGHPFWEDKQRHPLHKPL